MKPTAPGSHQKNGQPYNCQRTKECFDLSIKQGYALKNWVEGLSDEAYYPWESSHIKMTKIHQYYICQRTK